MKQRANPTRNRLAEVRSLRILETGPDLVLVDAVVHRRSEKLRVPLVDDVMPSAAELLIGHA